MTAPEIDRRPILCLAVGDESYGVQRSWESVVAGFSARQIPVTFALIDRDGPLSRAMIASPARTVFAPPLAIPVVRGRGVRKFLAMGRRGTSLLRLVSWLAGVIRQCGARAVLVMSPFEVLLAGFASRQTGITAFWMLPNAISQAYAGDLNRRLYRLMFRGLPVVPLANSHYTDGTIGPGTFARHVVHLGVDEREFAPGRATPLTRRQFGIPDDAAVVGVFARMVGYKGQLLLVEALAGLGAAAKGVHLLLCGGPVDDEYAASIRAAAATAGLGANVHLPGPVDAIADHYALCDIVANTRLDPEPFGVSVIEGMMMGKPVLVHRAGGPGETVIDGVTGWYIDAPTREAFAAGLRRMLADRARWPAIGQAAHDHAMAHFTNDRMAERLLAAMAS